MSLIQKFHGKKSIVTNTGLFVTTYIFARQFARIIFFASTYNIFILCLPIAISYLYVDTSSSASSRTLFFYFFIVYT
jgi:hypothetical protein